MRMRRGLEHVARGYKDPRSEHVAGNGEDSLSEQQARVRSAFSLTKLRGKSPDQAAESAGCERNSLAARHAAKTPRAEPRRAARWFVEAQ